MVCFGNSRSGWPGAATRSDFLRALLLLSLRRPAAQDTLLGYSIFGLSAAALPFRIPSWGIVFSAFLPPLCRKAPSIPEASLCPLLLSANPLESLDFSETLYHASPPFPQNSAIFAASTPYATPATLRHPTLRPPPTLQPPPTPFIGQASDPLESLYFAGNLLPPFHALRLSCRFHLLPP
jgi:hypothetical protein